METPNSRLRISAARDRGRNAMSRGDMIQGILDAVRPPAGDWTKDNDSLGISALLVGSTAALIQCWKFIESDQNLITMHTWNSEKLFQDLEATNNNIKEKNIFDWGSSPNFSIWSFGFFLNKAQNNLAATLDRCVNAWLVAKFRNASREPEDERLRGIYIDTRLWLLRSLVTEEAGKKIDALRDGFSAMQGTVGAANHIRELTSKFALRLSSGISLEELFRDIRTECAVCTSIVFSRVNDFKHLSGGSLGRFSWIYLIEWILTARATMWTGEFWKTMVADKETPILDILQGRLKKSPSVT